MATVETALKVSDQPVIEITEIISKGLGEGELEALFECEVVWHPKSVDGHIASFDPEELTSKDKITIRHWSRESIVPGTYRQIKGIFEKEE